MSVKFKIGLIVAHSLILVAVRGGIGPIILVDFGFMFLLFKSSSSLIDYPLFFIAILSIIGKLLLILSFFKFNVVFSKGRMTLTGVLSLFISYILVLIFLKKGSSFLYSIISGIPFLICSIIVFYKKFKSFFSYEI